MVANYGMSDKIGLLNFGQNDASNQFYKPYSRWAPQPEPIPPRNISLAV